MNSSTSIENMEVSQINYSLEKVIQAMAQLPDDGIVDFGRVAEDLESGKKLGAIAGYLYQEEEN